MTPDSPAFGQADLTNCEQELIHLAGSVQPHGLLLVLSPDDLRVTAASDNAAALLGLHPEHLFGRALPTWAPQLAEAVVQARADLEAGEPVPLQGATDARQHWEGALHAVDDGRLVLELEPVPARGALTVEHDRDALMQMVGGAVERLGQAASLGVLADATVRAVRDLIGHDRVMVYKFDADGHGEIIAEARDPRLESLLGHHYPASDIPQRARALYMRNRVRVLVDVHYTPSLLRDAAGRLVGDALDLSMSYLRSMSPLHLQYLQNMGVTATLVVSLVRDGQLWGLIAAHHYAPRNVRHALRAACDLIGEVVSTRIAAIENYAHAQVAVLVRRLEQRLVEATSTEGDWRLALFRHPRHLLQPLEATGGALFAEGEVLTAGEVPSTPELRALQAWVDTQAQDRVFAHAAVGKANPALASLTPMASGVLAVRLSATASEWLMWFRKEQLHTVTWAGDPNKPMVGDDPMHLSPRRSFAAWSELVRGTAVPWTPADLALGRAFGQALVDIIVQVHAVRLLVAEHQLAGIRNAVRNAGEPVLITRADGGLIFANAALLALVGRAETELPPGGGVDSLFDPPAPMREVLALLGRGQPHWRGELALARSDGGALPVAVRAEGVPGRHGQPLGLVFTLVDLRDTKRAAEARRHLEASLQNAMSAAANLHAMQADPATGLAGMARSTDPLLTSILTHASLAAMDFADHSTAGPVAPMLEQLERSTQRATLLYGRIRGFTTPRDDDDV
ncbi:GAF domain-containing protein [Rubrivivax albus]|uniref:GAF domain-containing protein n=1 Tax=Rubrivivax albus TaxID=2499835 RepID=A0A3S2X0D7_9BURK|nr:GAF domain-containing protein [Rubrivivax albus]RVT50777.1 GAF domain-containing protein [Rubrivivax albus]